MDQTDFFKILNSKTFFEYGIAFQFLLCLQTYLLPNNIAKKINVFISFCLCHFLLNFSYCHFENDQRISDCFFGYQLLKLNVTSEI